MPDGEARDYPRAGRRPALVRSASSSRFRLFRIIAGFLLLALGIVGLFLPVLQGVLMILGGLALLRRDLPWARAVTEWVTAKVRRRASSRRQRPTP